MLVVESSRYMVINSFMSVHRSVISKCLLFPDENIGWQKLKALFAKLQALFMYYECDSKHLVSMMNTSKAAWYAFHQRCAVENMAIGTKKCMLFFFFHSGVDKFTQ